MSKFEKLGEISDISLGRDFRGAVPVVPNGDILVIQPKDVFSESIEEAVRVTPKEIGAINDRWLHPGDILCSIRHKFVSIVVKEEWLGYHYGRVIANSGLFIIRLNQKDYLPEYVSAFVNCFFERKEFQDMLERQKQEKIRDGKKPTVRLLTKDCLASVLVPKKSLEEQRKIATEICEAQSKFRTVMDSLIEDKKHIEDKYKQIVKDYCMSMDHVYKDIVAK